MSNGRIHHCKNAHVFFNKQQIDHLTSIANSCIILVFFPYHFEFIDLENDNDSDESEEFSDDSSQQNEQSILMNQHLARFQFVLQDIRQGFRVILRDRFWFKRYIMRKGDTYYKKFPWKQTLIEQPLEGAAVYIGKGQIVCSKRVPGRFEPKFCHPYYQAVRYLHNTTEKFPPNPRNWSKSAKLVKHMYFHC